ncbi:MAG: carbohydrate-binding domain-containing protein [Clostridia bacterium]|nr:carbohydrate-binding domain-containing protein [Clostridia bacterium]
MKKFLSISISLLLLAGVFSACSKEEAVPEGTEIVLSDSDITVDGEKVTSDKSGAVYVTNDIVYYEEGHDFTYGEGSEEEAHSKDEADAHTVVHISKAGTYVLSGKLSKGQVAIDLGEDAETDPEAKVNLILNNADITCEVAPAIIFYNVYECCEADEDAATKDVDTSKAGANVTVADGSQNNINGSYVAKIYKSDSVVLSEDGKEVEDADKLHKYDGAFYSKMSMNINGGEKGDGVLNINAENEGLDSELHLTINSGNINIVSGNDGINTNEDNVSVTTINGGNLNIIVNGSTGEGDGIDSNGWLVINGGNVTTQACATSGDAGIDSDKGIHINGGTVFSTGNMLDRISESKQNFAVFTFAQAQENGEFLLKNSENKEIIKGEVENKFTYLIVSSPDLAEGDYSLFKGETKLQGAKTVGAANGVAPQMPEGMTLPEGEIPQDGHRPEKPEGEMPEGMTRPEGEFPQGGQRPEKPEGELPEGMTFPEGMTRPDGEMHPGNRPQQSESAETSDVFKITAGENCFVSVK